jgi:hypothetical protein
VIYQIGGDRLMPRITERRVAFCAGFCAAYWRAGCYEDNKIGRGLQYSAA